MPRSRRALSLALATLAAACVGTSTGNPVKPPDGMTPEVPSVSGEGSQDFARLCNAMAMPLDSIDTVSPLGFSAADVLALAPTEDLPLEWLPAGSDSMYGPESGKGTLKIELTPRGQPKYVKRSSGRGRNGGPEMAGVSTLAPMCPDALDVGVTLHLQTSGGAFDEQFDTALRASSQHFAAVSVTRKAADVEGGFTATRDNGWNLTGVTFEVVISALQSLGTISPNFEKRTPAMGDTPGAVSAGRSRPIAQWPTDRRCKDSFDATIDQDVAGFNAQDGVDLLNAQTFEIVGPDGVAQALDLSFAPSSPNACAILQGTPLHAYIPLPSVDVAGQLTLRSADGKLDGQWPVQLRASGGDGGALGEVRVAYELQGSITASIVKASEFESTYGMHDIDLSSYSEAGVVIDVKVGPNAAESGKLIVNGLRGSACSDTPSADRAMTVGCSGLNIQPIWTASIRAK